MSYKEYNEGLDELDRRGRELAKRAKAMLAAAKAIPPLSAADRRAANNAAMAMMRDHYRKIGLIRSDDTPPA